MKLGIIGGLGPLATAYYYELLTKMSNAQYDQDHLEIYIHSCPQIPDRTSYILDHNQENPVHSMIEVGIGLKNQGVDYLTIPCMTAHYFYDELSRAIQLPIIHPIYEIGEYLEKKKIRSVGIMATTGTITTQLFQKELNARGIKVVVPNEKGQEDIMHLIYKNIKCGTNIEMERFERVSHELFHQDVEVIILGCTELSIVKKEHHLGQKYLDVLELLAAIALQKCGISIKKEYQYLID